MECQVCLRHNTREFLPGGPILEDEHVFAAHFPLVPEEMPVHLGRVIIEMKRHIVSPSEMTESEAAALGVALFKLTRALESALGAEHVYIFRIGDKTPHLHLHLVPRYPGTPREYWGLEVGRWPQSPKADAASAVLASEKLREFVRNIG